MLRWVQKKIIKILLKDVKNEFAAYNQYSKLNTF